MVVKRRITKKKPVIKRKTVKRVTKKRSVKRGGAYTLNLPNKSDEIIPFTKGLLSGSYHLGKGLTDKLLEAYRHYKLGKSMSQQRPSQ